VGSAAAIFKIASTLAAGGGGGAPYARYCGAGEFASGIGVSPVNESLWNAQLRCNDGNHPANFGNTDTPPFNTANTLMACPVGQVMVGLTGRNGPISWAPTADFVIAVAPRCQSLSGGPVSDPFIAEPGSATGTPFSLNCPAGRAVTGVVGGAGSIVDSIALVCGPLTPAGPVISSVSPAAPVAAGFGQMLTINGTSLPATGAADVLFNQGGADIAAPYVWDASATRVIARMPMLAVGTPTTVRLKNPANTISSNAFPITISATPAAPVITAVLSGCAGSPITSIAPGAPIGIAADGIDSSGARIVWTNTATGLVLTQSFLAATGGPSGSVCVFPTSPAASPLNIGAPTLSTGTWRVEIDTVVNAVLGARSNGVLLTVP